MPKATPSKKTTKSTSKAATRKQTKWNKDHNVKLLALFDNNIIDPNNLNTSTIHQVLGDHFPGRSYSSFYQVYKRKAREYNIAKTKHSTRKEIGKNKE